MDRTRRTHWVLLVVLLMASTSPRVFGHAMLVRSQPSAKATLKEPPKNVQLWFSEELEVQFSSIVVTDQNGKRVDRNDISPGESKKSLQISLEDLSGGVYTVEWKALSTDEHTMKGKFSFTVATNAATATQTPQPQRTAANATPAPSQLPAGTPESSESMQASSSSWAQSIVRWFQYLAMITLFGGFAFYLTVLAPAIKYVRTDSLRKEITQFSERRILLCLWLSVLLLLVTSLIALVQQASLVFDKTVGEALSPSILIQVLTKTGYGGAWFLQIIATAAFLIILFLLGLRTKKGRSESGRLRWWIGLVAGGVLLVAPSWTGHAAAAAKDFRLAVFTDWLHIVAGGFWVGALFHLALTGVPARSLLDSSERGPYVAQIIRRFTQVAIPSVVVLVIAGLYNTWVHIESFQAFGSTVYGRTLLIKLALVGVMLVLGGLNTFHFGKKVAQVSKVKGDSLGNLERGFRRSVSAEAAIGVVVLLVTAILVFLTPARSHPQTASNETQIIQPRR